MHNHPSFRGYGVKTYLPFLTSIGMFASKRNIQQMLLLRYHYSHEIFGRDGNEIMEHKRDERNSSIDLNNDENTNRRRWKKGIVVMYCEPRRKTTQVLSHAA
jgi:hypothetical protein